MTVTDKVENSEELESFSSENGAPKEEISGKSDYKFFPKCKPLCKTCWGKGFIVGRDSKSKRIQLVMCPKVKTMEKVTNEEFDKRVNEYLKK